MAGIGPNEDEFQIIDHPGGNPGGQNPAGNNGGGGNPGGDGPGGAGGPIPDPVPRLPKTHTEAAVAYFRSLRLDQKLEFNKKIEDENDRKKEAAFANNETASLASFMTLDDEEWEELGTVRAVWEMCKEKASKATIRMVEAVWAKAGKDKSGSPRKRARVESDDDDDTALGLSQRNKMSAIIYLDPKDEVDWEMSDDHVASVPHILVFTEAALGVPLNWCGSANFDYIVRNIEKLPKTSWKDYDTANGRTVTTLILDVDKILSNNVDARYKEEMRPLARVQPASYGEFISAIDNMIAIQSAREDSSKGQTFNSDWYREHFATWRKMEGIANAKYFHLWIELEREGRANRRVGRRTANKAQIKSKWEAMLLAFQVAEAAGRVSNAGGDSSSHGSQPFRLPSGPSAQRHGQGGAQFQGGGKSGSQGGGQQSKDICSICGFTGHRARRHRIHEHGSLKKDGSPMFTKYWNGDFVRADKVTQSVCIGWNSSGRSDGCTHSNARSHICSFCGEAGHWALSGTCLSL